MSYQQYMNMGEFVGLSCCVVSVAWLGSLARLARAMAAVYQQ